MEENREFRNRSMCEWQAGIRELHHTYMNKNESFITMIWGKPIYWMKKISLALHILPK